MNRVIYTAFVAFWSSIATLLIVQALVAAPAEGEDEGAGVYTLAEVAEHDSIEGCWMVIRGAVYDLTEYIPRHPTDREVLAPWCGTEATEGMETKGVGREHSDYAWGLLEDYRIGRLAGEE
ncbi:cytochrome b5 domain-containing protein [Arhodomonas sp. SL1]|uniref:cytochrome b5 domain-containing protein n=1 Tax=Arhodomonas sp. SL1 TaxID=3425691 RepID=UPI003F881AFA